MCCDDESDVQDELCERIIRLSGDIDTEHVDQAIVQLHKMMSQPGQVDMLINSDGGSLEDGFRLIDAMRIASESGSPIHTVVTGKAYSMAAFIACAGDIRTAYPSARYMIHQPRYDSLGGEDQVYTRDDLRILVDEMDHYYAEVERLLMAVGVSADESVRLLSKDSYFGIDDAMRYGIAQAIETGII